MAATVWKGYLSFGLISVPIRLHVAARSERVGFNQIHKECNSRIRQKLYCPVCDRQVERSELIKGYEYGKDHYVLVEDEEIKKMAPKSGATMEILEFVKLDEVDPLYFDSSFFAVPEEAGQKAYYLLVETMESAGYAAVAKMSMHQREYTVLVRPRKGGLTLHTMHYPSEIRELAEYGQPGNAEVKPQEVKLARQLAESLAAPFEPDKYHDEYQQQLRELIEAKRQGETVPVSQAPRLAPVIDLMEALQQSLAAQPEKKPPARTNHIDAEPAAAKKSSRPKRARNA